MFGGLYEHRKEWIEKRLKEDDYWLYPIEDRRRIDSEREGMLEGFPLGSYLLLLDATREWVPDRMFREGKDCIADEARGILARIGGAAP